MGSPVTILGRLSAGGNGDCYLGFCADTGQRVVVKYLREFHLPDARRGFVREVRVLASKLRGLIPLLDAKLEVDQPYYVMPFLPGGSLTAKAGFLTDGQLRTIALEVSSTLSQLHRRSIAHGDIKPDNILIGTDGHLSIADPLGNGFGCTVLFARNCGGTPGYWAPEVKAGEEISQAGDVYSLGATLYHLATGRAPRDGERLELPLSSSLVLRDLVTACCATRPGDRPTMSDVRRIVGGERWAAISATRRSWRTVGGAVAAVGLFALLSEAE